jgi:hypothetical protein
MPDIATRAKMAGKSQVRCGSYSQQPYVHFAAKRTRLGENEPRQRRAIARLLPPLTIDQIGVPSSLSQRDFALSAALANLANSRLVTRDRLTPGYCGAGGAAFGAPEVSPLGAAFGGAAGGGAPAGRGAAATQLSEPIVADPYCT